jgi:GTP-binding protein
MFVDRALITVQAGDGGNGRVSFRREKYINKGGPNGGNGAKGGDVVLVADEGLSTLYDFKLQPRWEAQRGEDGGIKQQSGKAGEDLIIRLPPGTLVFEGDGETPLIDLKPGDEAIIARGGRGGFGNEHFKSSTNQTPRYAEPGEKGQERRLRLELKLIADVGFVGLPNAGKSTLLAALTRANPKVAAYPFTTLAPQLGIAEVDPSRRLVLADIPGLIEGASQGLGLGHEFLRHVERTRAIVHLLDVTPPDGSDPAQNYETIRAELAAYSPALADKPELICLNKMDLLPDPKAQERAVKKLCADLGVRRKDVLAISGAARINLADLLERLWTLVHPRGETQDGWKGMAADAAAREKSPAPTPDGAPRAGKATASAEAKATSKGQAKNAAKAPAKGAANDAADAAPKPTPSKKKKAPKKAMKRAPVKTPALKKREEKRAIRAATKSR